MLLTQSHASILLSTAIVLFFTSALFLSGFAVQRRTLRDLRSAIKPKPHPSPKIILPDRFRSQTTELEDGTIVVLESEAEREAREIEAILRGEKRNDVTTIEVKPTVPGTSAAGTEGDVHNDGSAVRDQSHPDPRAGDQKPISRAERRRLIKEELKRLSQDETKVYYQRRLW